jgi:alpha/beta superfamily hydrolase
METKVDFPSTCGDLEGLCSAGVSDLGVVITHPHPQYGGDMTHPVVAAITSAYRQRDFTTLRFNFRGVGNSAGHFDQGIGEQDDVRAAVSFLVHSGLKAIHLSGYSFGAWVNAMVVQGGPSVQGVTMVAPPVAFIVFEAAIRLPMLSTVVAGSRDEIAPPDLIRPLISQWNPDARIDVIDGADHFFFGCFDEITRRLARRMRSGE